MKSEQATRVLNERVFDHMTRAVATVQVSDTLDLVVARMRALRVSGFPVVDPFGNVAGVLSEVDVARTISPVKNVDSFPAFLEIFLRVNWTEPPDTASVLHSRLRHSRAGACMSSPAVTVAPEATLAEAASILGAKGINRLPVTDRAGKLLGIFTRDDLIRAIGSQSSAEPDAPRPAAARQAVPA